MTFSQEGLDVALVGRIRRGEDDAVLLRCPEVNRDVVGVRQLRRSKSAPVKVGRTAVQLDQWRRCRHIRKMACKNARREQSLRRDVDARRSETTVTVFCRPKHKASSHFFPLSTDK